MTHYILYRLDEYLGYEKVVRILGSQEDALLAFSNAARLEAENYMLKRRRAFDAGQPCGSARSENEFHYRYNIKEIEL